MKKIKSKKEPEVYSYETKTKGKLWGFRHKYYNALGERKEKKSSGHTSEAAAIKALLQVKAALLSGGVRKVEHENMTVTQWLDLWYEANKNSWKSNTREARETAIRLHIKPLLGHYKLQKLDRNTYQRKFINILEKEYKKSTVEAFHTIFKTAINAAVEDEILPRNRFTKVNFSLEEATKKDIKHFTPEQLDVFLKTTKEHENITNYTYLLTLAYSGFRRGEALGLQWKDIDFDNKTITIERTRDNKAAGSPKTKNSYRTILVDELVMKQLETYRLWCKKTMLKYGCKFTDSSFVFISGQSGKAVTKGSVTYAMEKITKIAKLPRSVTLHGLRHTHATFLLSTGLDAKTIADRLGNTPQMIYDTYGHVLKETEKKSVSLFSQVVANGAETGASL